MSNWDDEDFDVPVAAAGQTFDDEDDGDVLDSWEAAGESEDESNQVKGPSRKKVPAYVRAAEREAKQQEEREKAALKKQEEDPKAKKERLKKLEVENDLNSAAALFGEATLHPKERAAANQTSNTTSSEPGKLSDLAIFKPKTKAEFDSLRKTLVPILTGLSEQGQVQFASWVTDFVRDVCKPLTSDQARKVTSTLNALTNEKQREERMSRGAKKKKPIVKEMSAKIDEAKDTTNYNDFGDDEDDFM